jgi:hypothetical protein
VYGVAEVVTVPQHGADLLIVAVAASVDNHLTGNPRRYGRTVPHGDQVQRQVNAAGDPSRGGDPAVNNVKHVTEDSRPRVAAGELLLDVMVGGAAPAVEQAGPPQGIGPGADAGDSAATGVMSGEHFQRGGVQRPGARDRRADPPAGHDDEIVTGERGPAGRCLDGDALGGRNVFLPGDVGQLVAAAQVGGGAESLGRPG